MNSFGVPFGLTLRITGSKKQSDEERGAARRFWLPKCMLIVILFIAQILTSSLLH
jgi:hypothetical protein